MKNKNSRILLIISILLSFVACSSDKKNVVTHDLPKAGVSFDLPVSLQNRKGVLVPDYGFELAYSPGVYVAGLTYFAFPKDQFDTFNAKESLTEEENNFVYYRMIEALHVFAIDGGRSLDDLKTIVNSYGLPGDKLKDVGKVGDYSFYYMVNPFESIVDQYIIFDEGYRQDYDEIVKLLDNTSYIRVYEPTKDGQSSKVEFETTDLDGNKINSADIFSKNKITMINLWGTYCGPCINEMPDLETLSKRLEEKGCGIIGIVIDIAGSNDTSHIEAAKAIIRDTGVTYLNMLPFSGIDSMMPAEFIPTTYFVDQEGNIVGSPAVGARGADDYEALIDQLLK